MAFLSTMPNLTIYSPATQQELVHMLELAISRGEPAAVRYPRGSLMQAVSAQPIEKGVWEEMQPIAEQTVIATGSMIAVAIPVCRKLGVGLVNARTIQPMDEAMLARIKRTAKRVVVMEEGVDCLGLRVNSVLSPVPVVHLCVPNDPVLQACVNHQRQFCGLTAEVLEQRLTEELA
jgi:1-deoxy-D-xylulose-5-phosphate synthase